MLGIAQTRASLEISWRIMRKRHRYSFDSSQSQGFVVFSVHSTRAGVLVDSWLVSLPEKPSEALFFNQIEFCI